MMYCYENNRYKKLDTAIAYLDRIANGNNR